MLYNPPTGSSDPNAGYQGKNPSAGQQGSKVPRMAVEAPQREIVAAIEGAGLAPTNADLTQLLQAIRRPLYGEDRGAPNAVAVSIPMIASVAPGRRFVVRIREGNDNTGATTLQVNNLTPRNVVYPTGDALIAGELYGGRYVEVLETAAGFLIASPPVKVSPTLQTLIRQSVRSDFFINNPGQIGDVALDSDANPGTNTILAQVSMPAGYFSLAATSTVTIGQGQVGNSAQADYQLNLYVSQDGGNNWTRMEWTDFTKPAGTITVSGTRTAFRGLDPERPTLVRSTVYKRTGTTVATPASSSLQVQSLR